MKRYKVKITAFYETETDDSFYEGDQTNLEMVEEAESDNAAETLGEALSQGDNVRLRVEVTEIEEG